MHICKNETPGTLYTYIYGNGTSYIHIRSASINVHALYFGARSTMHVACAFLNHTLWHCTVVHALFYLIIFVVCQLSIRKHKITILPSLRVYVKGNKDS